MPKMSEGNKQEQAALDSIMAIRRKKKPMSEGSMQEGATLESAKSARKAKKMSYGGKVHKMKSGGKVRGSGCCKRVKKCKMY